ncbi:MAG: membrane dipeptidase [Firmicutes bacterium]|nr:membrane dipeptidase [Bacillota bacterium]
MNELGIIVDTAHLSEGGFYDVAKYSKKPFIASHSCCRALCGHSRNLTDDQLKVVGDTGSVVGINFFKNFLSDTADVATVDLLVQHALHIKDKAGVEALAFGSDYDGIGDAPVEWGDVDGIYNVLVPALEKVLTDDELEKMCNGNFLRVLAENEK